jgi:NAD(P)-dependent dehydrogenase (short-subunit alcohol dehydrogenase family)
MSRRFEIQTVIVTGGAQGIGMGISLAFAREGANVVIADIDVEAGEEHAARLQNEGAHVTFVQTDVSKEADVQRAVQTAVDTYGSIHVLVNNAGIGWTGNLFTRPMDEWDHVLAVNLRGPYMMAKYAAPYLMQNEHPGAIVNIASTRALMSEPNSEPYSASKGGLLALTHSLAISLGPRVRVNAISPGWIEVSDWKKQSARTTVHHRPEDLAQHPVGRVGTPMDIAEACLFLASREAGFITGQNLVIDGGMTVKMIYVE